MDVMTDADGDLAKDTEWQPPAYNEEKEWHKIHITDVLVHWQGCQQYRRVLPVAGKWKALSL
jgi:hypothetical protein